MQTGSPRIDRGHRRFRLHALVPPVPRSGCGQRAALSRLSYTLQPLSPRLRFRSPSALARLAAAWALSPARNSARSAFALRRSSSGNRRSRNLAASPRSVPRIVRLLSAWRATCDVGVWGRTRTRRADSTGCLWPSRCWPAPPTLSSPHARRKRPLAKPRTHCCLRLKAAVARRAVARAVRSAPSSSPFEVTNHARECQQWQNDDADQDHDLERAHDGGVPARHRGASSPRSTTREQGVGWFCDRVGNGDDGTGGRRDA